MTKIFNLKNNKSFFKFFFNLLIRNRFILIAIVLNTMIISLFPVIFLANKENVNFSFKENSLLILLVPMVLLMMFVCASIVVIFIKTKRNNVDLYAYIKPIKNREIIWMKELVVWLLSLHIILGVTLAAIIESAMGLNFSTSSLVWLGSVVSVLIMGFIWTIIISSFPIFMNFMSSLISVFAFSGTIIIAGVIPFIIQQSKVIETSFNLADHKNNLLKIYELDKNNNVENVNYAVYENPLGKHENSVDGWKPSSFVSYSPFNVLLGLSTSISSSEISNNIDKRNLVSSNNRFSTSYLSIDKTNISEHLFNNNHLVAGFSEKTIFDIASKQELFKELDNILLKNKNIDEYKDNDAYWSIQKSELMSRNIWKNSFSNDVKNMILHIAGLDSSDSMLYSIFNQYSVVENKINGFYDFLTDKYSDSFSKFIKFIWTNMNVKLNIYSYKTLGDFKDINKYHPSLKSYDELEPADKYDLEFIKNKFFNVIPNKDGNGLKVQVLNSNGVYRDLLDDKIFPESPIINSVEEFNDYIDGHSTINNLKEIIENVKNRMDKNEAIYPVEFQDNVSNYYVIQSQLSINENSTVRLQWVYLIAILFVALGIEYTKIKKVMRKDIL